MFIDKKSYLKYDVGSNFLGSNISLTVRTHYKFTISAKGQFEKTRT